MCLYIENSRLKVFLHLSHWIGIFPECVFKCLIKLNFRKKDLPQNLQDWAFLLKCNFICWSRTFSVVKIELHFLHLNFFFSWFLSFLTQLFLWVNRRPHLPQLYFLSAEWLYLCIFNWNKFWAYNFCHIRHIKIFYRLWALTNDFLKFLNLLKLFDKFSKLFFP